MVLKLIDVEQYNEAMEALAKEPEKDGGQVLFHEEFGGEDDDGDRAQGQERQFRFAGLGKQAQEHGGRRKDDTLENLFVFVRQAAEFIRTQERRDGQDEGSRSGAQAHDLERIA